MNPDQTNKDQTIKATKQVNAKAKPTVVITESIFFYFTRSAYRKRRPLYYVSSNREQLYISDGLLLLPGDSLGHV